MRSLIDRLRARVAPGDGDATDEQLLTGFLATRDEGAFSEIVRRHGPMVRGVCRRVLGNAADADDACQAVWLVLLRKADTVRPRSRLGNFLYGVAANVARRGRDAAARRRARPLARPLAAEVPGRPDDRGEQTDWREVLDRELSALPGAYRAAVVACDLEGSTRAEAAGRLGWSEGTVASRLARGRALLADRLTRRGLTLPAAGLAVVVEAGRGSAGPVPNLSALLSSPSPAAEVLAREAVRAMLTNKLRTAAVLLLAAVGLAGIGAATVWACGGLPRPTAPAAKPHPEESAAVREPQPDGKPPGAAKNDHFVLTNPAGDITVVSDRSERLVEFFRRLPVMVAGAKPEVRERLLSGKASNGPVFVTDASFNLRNSPRVATYGASVRLAAVPLGGPVYRELSSASDADPLVLVRDPADPELWHAVGWTRRPPVGFFASTERGNKDDFAPADLLQTTDKK